MYKSILMPVDLNDDTSWNKALPVALAQCKAFDAKLSVLTVLPSFGVSVVSSYFPPDFEKKAQENAAQQLRQYFEDHVPEPYRGHVLVAEGTVYEEILKCVKKLGFDLVVMAAHRPDLKSFLLGPNAARVVRHAEVSVLVVR